MNVGQFINSLKGLGVTDQVGINANSKLNETFLDFLYNELYKFKDDQYCRPILKSGTPKDKKNEYDNGSAIFVAFPPTQIVGDTKFSTTMCYTKLYKNVESSKSQYPNGGYVAHDNSVLVYVTPDVKNTTPDKNQQQKTPTQINWAQFPCVTGATGIVEGKENNQVVYSGSGYVWYGNGSRKEIKTNKISFYECSSDGKILAKSTPPKLNNPLNVPKPETNIEGLNFLDSTIGELTKGLDANKITQDFISSVGGVQKENIKNKKLVEQLNRIKQLLK